MKSRVLLLLATALLSAGCGGKNPSTRAAKEGVAPQSGTNTEFAATARAATQRVQRELQQALSEAMRDGGPASALEVCSVQAPGLAGQVSTETGVDVRRVSERNRNPDNVPTAPQIAVLHHFQANPAVEDTVIVEGDGPTYMRAIRVGVDLCLQCHGEPASLAEDVKAKLAELYPQDKATGFGMGDLRGAFVARLADAEGQ